MSLQAHQDAERKTAYNWRTFCQRLALTGYRDLEERKVDYTGLPSTSHSSYQAPLLISSRLPLSKLPSVSYSLARSGLVGL